MILDPDYIDAIVRNLSRIADKLEELLTLIEKLTEDINDIADIMYRKGRL